MTTLFDEDLTFEIAKELIKNGADVNYQSEGYTPLFFVKTIDVAQLLIDHGADVNAKDNNGDTPLFYLYDFDIIKLLIEHNANVNHIGYQNKTILFSVLELRIADLLIANGANVNALSCFGSTPLFYVNTIELAELFIKHGAMFNIRNIYGYSVLDSLICTTMSRKDVNGLIKHGLLFGKIENYQKHRFLFPLEKQEAFDAFASITSNDEDFFQMCLAYQESIKNNVKMDITDMEII